MYACDEKRAHTCTEEKDAGGRDRRRKMEREREGGREGNREERWEGGSEKGEDTY